MRLSCIEEAGRVHAWRSTGLADSSGALVATRVCDLCGTEQERDWLGRKERTRWRTTKGPEADEVAVSGDSRLPAP